MSDDGHCLDVSRETRATLDEFVALLRRWQTVKNLVGPATLDDVWSRHVADSLQLRAAAPPAARRWLDLGSGAGFPGLVIAIACAAVPGFQIHLVDSNSRKCAFLREAVRSTRAPARVVHARLETVVGSVSDVDVVCARALAPLVQLLDWTAPLLTTGTTGLFPKGRDAQSELTVARRRWRFDVETISSRTDPEAQILRITGLSPIEP